ncbi:hypothetical protein D3C80_1743820 [compost metagenome]
MQQTNDLFIDQVGASSILQVGGDPVDKTPPVKLANSLNIFTVLSTSGLPALVMENTQQVEHPATIGLNILSFQRTVNRQGIYMLTLFV